MTLSDFNLIWDTIIKMITNFFTEMSRWSYFHAFIIGMPILRYLVRCFKRLTA